MNGPRPQVLIAGMAIPDAGVASDSGPKVNKQMLQDDMANAQIAGYDCTVLTVHPTKRAEAMEEIRCKLQSRHWDLFVIGFGIRGNRAFTTTFEEAVNACVELSPGTRFGFAPMPDAVFQTILRVLPPC